MHRQITNRFFWNLSANYELNENLTATWRTGLDFLQREKRKQLQQRWCSI